MLLWVPEAAQALRLACLPSELYNHCHCSAQYCTASADGTTRVWDVATHAQLYEFDTPGEAALCCAYHPTRRELACGYDSGRVRVFDVAKAALVQEQQQHRAAVTDILCAPSGLLLFSMGELLLLQLGQSPSAADKPCPGLQRSFGHMVLAAALAERLHQQTCRQDPELANAGMQARTATCVCMTSPSTTVQSSTWPRPRRAGATAWPSAPTQQCWPLWRTLGTRMR